MYFNSLIKRFFGKLLPVIAVITTVFAVQSCSKKENKAQDLQDIVKNKQFVLMKNMNVCTVRLYDSVNNIKLSLVYPRYIAEDDDNIDLTLSNKLWEDDIRNFAKYIKTLNQDNKKDTNTVSVMIRSIYEDDDIVSVLYEKRFSISGQKDTSVNLISINYNKDNNNIYTFFDVFNVNSNNLKEFNDVFNSQFTLEELKNIGFNIEKHIVGLYKNEGNTFKRYIATDKHVKKFLIDD